MKTACRMVIIQPFIKDASTCSHVGVCLEFCLKLECCWTEMCWWKGWIVVVIALGVMVGVVVVTLIVLILVGIVVGPVILSSVVGGLI